MHLPQVLRQPLLLPRPHPELLSGSCRSRKALGQSCTESLNMPRLCLDVDEQIRITQGLLSLNAADILDQKLSVVGAVLGTVVC